MKKSCVCYTYLFDIFIGDKASTATFQQNII